QHGRGTQGRRARDPAGRNAAPEGARRQGRGGRRRRTPRRGPGPRGDGRAHEAHRRAPEAQGSRGHGGLVTSVPSTGTDVTPEEHLPEVAHALAIIMDGSGRWAAERGVSVADGHRAGSRALRPVVETAIDLGIESLAVYAFSTENWSRPVDLADAARRVLESGSEPGDLDEDAFAACLYEPEMPDPDLVIRTSGERRISNFLLWQSAYAEYVFTDTLWPDFGPEELRTAIEEYARRRRRFGGR